MSRIVRIASWKGTPRASVVFVHGLGGHVYNTWRRAPDDDTFWPLWLARDVEGLAVYSLAYEAPASNWLGTSMPLQDRAVNIFEVLLTEPGLRTGPVIFVCHSLGGLIVKKVLLNLQQQATRRPEAADLLERVTDVVFAATPHTGSAHATWLDRLRFLAWPSSIARVLIANDPSLRDINVAYRGLADDRRSMLRHQIFYETRGTPAGSIVDEASADPGLSGDPPVPIDADHISIVKPQDRSSLLYARLRQFVERVPAVAGSGGDIEVSTLPAIRSDQPLNLVPKLIRICVLALAALIAFKGIQALVTQPVDVTKVQAPLVNQMAEKDRQIAKLIDLLNDKRTMPAPPGADRELKKTVAAIDEGAKVDPRYAQALELLKAGKPSEAEPLLKAVAEDKVKGADSANKDAAAAFRNLASIAAVSDPGRAREYYARATQLDPDNVEGLYWNASYQLQAGKLDTAQATYERLISVAGVQNPYLAFWSQTRLGDVLVSRGDLSGALKRYKDGFAIADKSAASTPGDTDWQHSLSSSFNRIGAVQLAQGDLPGALKSYQDGLAIAESLAKSDPGNTDWQRDWSISFAKIGDVQTAQGDLSGALRSYKGSLAIEDKLLESNPGNAEWQRGRSISFDRIGDVQVAQGDLPSALKSYSDSFAIRDKLARSDPGNADWQRDVSISFNKIGDVQKTRGDLPGALKNYSDGLAIADKLAKSDPGNAGWQHDLAISFAKIGDARKAQGDLPAALKNYEDGLTILDRLAKSDSRNAGWQQDLSTLFEKIGDVQIAQGDLSGALKNYNDILSIRDALAKSDPGNADWQHGLSVSFERIGIAQLAQGVLPGALKSFRDSLAIREMLTKSDPGNAGWRRDLASALFEIGVVLGLQNDKAAALDELRQGRDIMSRLTERAPDNAGWKHDLDQFDKQIADLTR
jgi:tetratricopeptide (TPR) repeat protein